MPEQLGWLDTNLFVHSLHTNDPHRARCTELLQALQSGDAEGWIDSVVVHELTYVLSRQSQFPNRHAVLRYIRRILLASGVRTDDAEGLLDAVTLWAARGISFADAWLTIRAARRGLPVCSVNVRDFPATPNTYRSDDG